MDTSKNVRHPAIVGAAAVLNDLGDPERARELCRSVLEDNPGPQTRDYTTSALHRAERMIDGREPRA
jgi:hypothetical protein